MDGRYIAGERRLGYCQRKSRRCRRLDEVATPAEISRHEECDSNVREAFFARLERTTQHFRVVLGGTKQPRFSVLGAVFVCFRGAKMCIIPGIYRPLPRLSALFTYARVYKVLV